MHYRLFTEVIRSEIRTRIIEKLVASPLISIQWLNKKGEGCPIVAAVAGADQCSDKEALKFLNVYGIKRVNIWSYAATLGTDRSTILDATSLWDMYNILTFGLYRWWFKWRLRKFLERERKRAEQALINEISAMPNPMAEVPTSKIAEIPNIRS